MTNKNDIDYTLLEIIEGPKRLNNLSHTRIFDYLLEATENQDRFEGLLKALEYNAYWAYLGIMIMASDMIPIPKLFEEEFKENITSSYTRGSTNEYGVFNMLLSYFERGILTEKKHRVYFTRYMRESLSDDEFKFCETCLKQVYKEEIYPLIKKMYENNKLNKKVYDFFSFTMNHKFDKVDKFTNICLPINTYKKYVKVGNTLFYNNELLNKKESAPILEFIRVTSLPGRAQIYINYPFVCELYIEDNATEPFMIVTTERAFLTKQPIKFNDIKFIELFYAGYKNFVCTNGKDVVSFISEENGFINLEEIKCKSIKKLKLPLLILGVGIDFLLCKLEDGSEITVFLPSKLVQETFKNGDTICVAKYLSTYYLRSKKED